jgi:hypothetical protein
VNARGFGLRTPDPFEEQYRLLAVKGKRFLVDNVKLLFRTQTPQWVRRLTPAQKKQVCSFGKRRLQNIEEPTEPIGVEQMVYAVKDKQWPMILFGGFQLGNYVKEKYRHRGGRRIGNSVQRVVDSFLAFGHSMHAGCEVTCENIPIDV